jgi:non-canonical (house-cleaning) NTP pyrophosphatase
MRESILSVKRVRGLYIEKWRFCQSPPRRGSGDLRFKQKTIDFSPSKRYTTSVLENGGTMSSKRGRPKHINIALGSVSAYKLEAIKSGCDLARLSPIIELFDIPSGQNAQPVGLDEMMAGALTRANTASKQPKCRNKFCFGIENGIVRCNGITFDSAMVVLRRPDRRLFWAQSPAIVFPEECVIEAERRGFKTHSVGSVFAEMYGGTSGDPHDALTYASTNRTKLIAHAVHIVLAQAFH